MIGCVLLGAAGLFAVARLIHHRRHGWAGGGCGGMRGGRWGHHRGDWDGPGGWDDGEVGPGVGFGGRFGRGFVLRAVAERLRATPEQARVIRDAASDLGDVASKLRGEAKKTRAEVAGAFRQSHFDAVLFGELFARHDGALEELRKAFVGAGARIHDALDEKQRARLADMIDAGPGFWRGGGRRAWSGRDTW